MLNHIKRLGKHSIVYGLGEFLYKGLSLIFIPVYTRYLVPSEYGVIEIVRSLGTIFVILMPWGLDSAFTRYYFNYKEEDAVKRFISTMLYGIAALGLLLTVIMEFGGSYLFSFWFKDIQYNPFIRLTVWTSYLYLFPAVLLIFLQIRERSIRTVFFQLFQAVVMFAAIIYFVVYLRAGALGQIQGRLIATLIASVAAIALFFKYLTPRFDFKLFVSSLKFGLPTTIHSLSWWTLSLSSRLILQKYVPLSEAGIYSLGQNIGMGMEIIISSFNRAWVPMLYSSAENEKPETFAKLTKYYLTVIVLIALGLSLFSREIITLLSTSSYYEAYEIVPIIALGYIFIGIYMMLTNQIFYKEKTHYFLFITPVSALVSVLLNFIMIPKWGMYGAATATMLSFVVFSIITYYFSMKVFPIPYDKKNICLLIASAVLAFFAAKYLTVFSPAMNIAAKLSIIALFCGSLWKLGFFSVSEKEFIAAKIASFVFKNNKTVSS